MICPHCQHDPLPTGARFCPNCGESIAPAEPATATHITIDQKIGTLNNGSVLGARLDEVRAGRVMIEAYSIETGAIHGDRVEIHRKPDVPRRREGRPRLRGRPPRHFVGRTDELALVRDAIEDRAPIEFFAPSGAGKTTLLRRVATADRPPLPDGELKLSAYNRPVDDLLQAICEQYYEWDHNRVLAPGEPERLLDGIEAAVLVDDVALAVEEMDRLLDALPSSAFVLLSTEQRLYRDGEARALAGLSLDEAIELIGLHLDRALEGADRSAAERICRALDGHPLALVQQLARLRQEKLPLDAAARALEATGNGRAARERLVAERSEPERAILALLGNMGGVPLEKHHIERLVHGAGPALMSLERLALVQSHSPSYTLTDDALAPLLPGALMSHWSNRLIEHAVVWAAENVDEPEVIMAESAAIERIVDLARRRRRWSELLQLVRLTGGALTLGRQWGTWGRLLERALEAAETLETPHAEAWARHQIGTRALGRGENDLARTELTRALEQRLALGDQEGAALTRHNLDLLGPPPAPPDDEPPDEGPPSDDAPPPRAPRRDPSPLNWPGERRPPPAAPTRRFSPLRLLWWGGLITVAVAILVISVGGWPPGSGPAPAGPAVIDPDPAPPPDDPPGIEVRYPDLTIAVLDESPRVREDSVTIALEYAVRNDGERESGSVELWGEAEGAEPRSEHVPALAPGATKSGVIVLELPRDVAGSTVTARLSLDRCAAGEDCADEEGLEIHEVRVAVPGIAVADLEVEIVEPPRVDRDEGGGQLTLVYRVVNLGEGAAPSTEMLVRVPGEGELAPAQQIPDLAPGEDVEQRLTVGLPPDREGDEIEVLISVDSCEENTACRIEEEPKENNHASVPVALPGALRAELSIVSVSDESGFANERVQVGLVIRVANEGELDAPSVPLIIELVDPAAGEVLRDVTDPIPAGRGGVPSVAVAFELGPEFAGREVTFRITVDGCDGGAPCTVVEHDESNNSVRREVLLERRPNRAPEVTLIEPRAGGQYSADNFDGARGLWYADVPVAARGDDPEDGALAPEVLRWATDRGDLQSGDLGWGNDWAFRLYAPECGSATHQITLVGTDSEGASDSERVSITVVGACPEPDLIVRASLRDVEETPNGILVDLSVTLSNIGTGEAAAAPVMVQVDGRVPDNVTAESERYGTLSRAAIGPLGPGATTTFNVVATLPTRYAGQQVTLLLTADYCSGGGFCRVDESDERNNEARVPVSIGRIPPAPVAQINQPRNGLRLNVVGEDNQGRDYALVTLSAVRSVGSGLTYRWTTNQTGLQARNLGTGQTLRNVRLYSGGCGSTIHVIRLTVTDGFGRTSSSPPVSVTVNLFCIDG